MNRVLGWDGISPTMPVEKYFGFMLPYPVERPINAAMYIQRQSRLRPRDIVVLLHLIQRECIAKKISNPNAKIFDSSELITGYSNYYTDQVKSEMMFDYPLSTIKSVFELIKTIKHGTFSENEFKTAFDYYCSVNPNFSTTFMSHRQLVNVLYSLDVIGWIEKGRYWSQVHWHYREVKAIDEMYRLPWEQFDNAHYARLLIHKGASKHILGVLKR